METDAAPEHYIEPDEVWEPIPGLALVPDCAGASPIEASSSADDGESESDSRAPIAN